MNHSSFLRSVGRRLARRRFLAIGACLAACSAASMAQECALYPIALSADTVQGLTPGTVLVDVYNGNQPGNFGWLTWGGSPSVPTLVRSLTPPGDSSSYANPDNPSDHEINRGDWVEGKPGVSNSKNVRDTLDALKDIDIIVPAWDAVRGQGNNADYRVAGFVRIRILSYSLPGQNRITARLIGFVTCGEENQAPVTDAGEDQTVVITNAAVLNGSVTDDGLPALSEVRSQWSVVSGPGSASFADPLAPATTATFSDIGTYTLRLTADDGELTASDDVAITVLPPNKPPVALPQDVETDEDVPADITLAGTDPDQDPLTFLVVDEPTNGVLSGSAPDMTYTPNPDYFGQDSFTFKAHDGQTDSVPAIVSITVNPVNDTPVADPQSLTTDEDMSLTITLAASDVENDPLTYAVAIFPDHGVLSGSAPDLLYAPNPDWHGTDTFSFVVSDLSATSAVSIVAIHVASVNDTPTAGAQTVSLDEDSTAAVMLSGSDADDDPLSFELLSAPSNGVLEGTAPNLVYRPADNFYGSDCFAFRVSDGLVYSDTASVMLAVQSVNDTPVANPQEVTTDEDVSVGVTLTGSDVENDALFFEIVSSPANGDLSGTLPDLLYIPTADFHGDDDFRFAVCDGSATSVPALVHVTIVSVNDPPAATAGAVTVMEDEAIAIVLTGSDPDGDPITFAVLDGPAHGSLSGVPPDLTYVPAADFFGSDSLGFTVGDGILTSAVTTVTIDVVPVNDAPVAHSQTLTTEEDIPLQIVLNATDVDNGVLTYAIMEEPAHGVLSGTAPDLLYTPDPDYNGLDALAFQASDGQTDSVPAVVSITVNPINDPPVALPQDVSTDEDVALNITLSGSDAENDALAFAVVTGPTNGVLVGTAPDLEYAPATDFHGEDSLVFVVSDASATSAPAVVRIVVISVNDPPVAEAQLVTTDERTPVGITLTGSDMDNDPLTFAIIEAPLGGSLSGAAPDVTYTPDNGFWGSDSLTFEVSDGFATSAPATVALDVRPLPRCRTYTTEADFQEGAFLNTDTLGRDQLQLRNSMEAFNSIWIAVSTKGTIVRIDTETGEVKGEYWSSPEGQPKNPSRTTVDLNGNVWTANRAGNSVVHIAVPESGRWIDKNNNGQLDTSTGYGDILPWPNTGGVDTDGGVDTAQDELIIHYVKTTSSGTRHVSVDSNNNVWVSGTGNRRWDLIDGNVGEIIRREPSVGFGGYGGLIDPNGVIWSSGNGLLRWNTALPLIGFNGGNWAGYGHAAYGIGIDSHGNIWVSQWGGGKVLKYAPDGMLLGVFDHHGYRAQGVAVDGDDCVWVAHSLSDGHTVAKLRNDGTWVGNVTVGSGPTGIAVDNNGKVWVSLYRDGRAVRIDPHAGPIGADGETPVGEVDLRTRHLGGALYNYSDMTGSTLTGVPEIGSWSAVFDSGLPGAEWGRITWNARVHNDGLLDVRVATGDDPDTLESFQHVTLSSNQLTGTGRYAKIMILFDRAASGHSPEVYDVTIGTKGCQEETIVPAWGVYAGDDEQVDWPGSFKLNGSVWHNDFGFDTNVPVEWTVLSGPGAVTFEDAAAKATFCDFSEKGVYALRLQAASGAEVRQDDLTLNVVPVNRPPWVYVGPDRAMRSFATPMALQATARDDGLPQGSTMSLQWTQEMGPGDTQFTDPHSTNTTVAFTNAGIYLLELTADDTELAYTDWLEARIAMLCTVKDVPGIVQWWPGNRNTREWVRGNDINLFNDSAYAPAKVSYGFSFNGNSDFASAFAHESANVGAGTGFTLEMWIKPDSARDGRIFEWCDITHQGVYFRQEADYNRFQVNLVDTNGATHWIDFDNALTYTGFQHIAFTYDKSSGQACLYKNAVLTHSVSVGSIALRTEGDIYIGGSVAPRFKGVMDEVTLYNRPLYADEILAVYVSDFVGKCPLDNNLAPVVDAGPDLALHEAGDSAWLAGSVTDDELPPMSDIYSEWTKVDGPGDVLFADPFSPQTSAEFSQPGIYVLRLTADDGCILVSDDVQVRVATPCEVDGPDGLAALWRANFSPRDEVADLLLHLASGVTYTNGRVSGGFSFDGSGSAWTEACSGLNIAADGEFTVEAWVNARAPTSTYPGLFSYGGGMYAGVRSPSILRINLADTAGNDHYMDVTDYFASQYDRFIHFALTYDLADGLARVYRNGIIVHEERLGSFTPDTRRDFALGAGGYCGILDEFSLYSRALEPDEVYAIFAAGEAGKCPVDDNEDPQVSAGPDLRLPEISQAVTLQGEVTDDGRPTNTTLRTSWSVVSGPGTVTFADASSPQTPATFSVPGTYMLNLTASDGSIRAGDKVQVRVEQPCSVIAPTGLTAWWPVNFDVEEASGGPALMLINGASFTNGAVSGALHLNGTGVAMARACPALDIGAEASFTIEAWVNVANRPGLGEWR
ncbi:MAG: tandem-95 repeat protein, partial [Phycisphaerae bacterium]|nr:tandem-95 repeat protein [Phycisphaerae bacterium]